MPHFIDGFDHYAIGDVGKKWVATGTPGSMQSGRFGGQCLRLNSTVSYIEYVPPTPQQCWRVGFALRPVTQSGYLVGLDFWDANSLQFSLRYNPSSKMAIYNSSGTLLGESQQVLALGSWYHVEIYAAIKDSIALGNVQVYVNGQQEINLPAGTDVKNTANAYATKLRFYGHTNANIDIDDVVITHMPDTTTPTLLGDRRVYTLYPDGNGTYSDFLGSDGNSTDNYLLVNETLLNTSNYVSSGTVGHRDSYTFTNLPDNVGNIACVQICSSLSKDDAGSRTGKLFVRSGDTNYDGNEIVLSTTPAFYRQPLLNNPATSAAWSPDAVNALQAGVKVES